MGKVLTVLAVCSAQENACDGVRQSRSGKYFAFLAMEQLKSGRHAKIYRVQPGGELQEPFQSRKALTPIRF